MELYFTEKASCCGQVIKRLLPIYIPSKFFEVSFPVSAESESDTSIRYCCISCCDYQFGQSTL